MRRKIDGAVRALRAVLLAVAVVAVAFAGWSCRGECEKLADKICECRSPSRLDKEACIQNFVDTQPVEFSDEQQNTCEDLRKNCSCEDLFDGRSDQCGLANGYN